MSDDSTPSPASEPDDAVSDAATPEPTADDPGRSGWQRPAVGVLIAAAVGLASFGITAAVRSGGGDSADSAPTLTASIDDGDGSSTDTVAPEEPTSTSDPSAPTPVEPPPADDATSDPDDPTVVEVEAVLVEPVDADLDGQPLPPPDGFVGTGSVDLVTSPIIGTSTADVVDDGDRIVTAPPQLPALIGLTPPSVDELIAEPSETADLDEVGPAPTADLPDDTDEGEVVGLLEDVAIDYGIAENAADDADPGLPGSIDDHTAPDDASDPVDDGLTLPVVDEAGGLADPCADLDDPERCPDPGEPGTIIETFALTVPPPLVVEIIAPGTDLCPADVSPFEQRLAIRSNTPLASFEMTYWPATSAADSQTLTLSTPEPEAAEWVDAFGSSTADVPPPIVHCTTLSDLRQIDHAYTAEATDVFDQTWSNFPGISYFPAPAALVPPTYLLTLSDNELLVSAPHRDDQSVAILAYRSDGESGEAPVDPCDGTARVVEGYGLPYEPINPEQITESTRGFAERGWDTRYDQRTLGHIRLDDGSTYRLCVHTSTFRPSFSAGREQTLAYDITTPDALQMTFEVVSVDTGDVTLPADQLIVDVAPAGRGVWEGYPWCGSWRNGADLSGDTTIEALVCNSHPRSSDLYRRSARVSMRITDVDGGRNDAAALIPITPCRMPCVIPDPETFVLELPSGRTQYDFLCGLFGDGCPSASDASFGTITLRVSYDNPDGSTLTEWAISEAQPAGDQRDDATSEPQLDTLAIPLVSPSNRSRPTIIVPVLADRAVRATAELVALDGSAPCMVDGATPSAASTDLSEAHTIEISDVCPSQSLLVVVELTDATGATSRWHGGGAALGPADSWRRGFVTVPGFRLAANVETTVTVPTGAVRFDELDVALSGRSVRWSRSITDYYCLQTSDGPVRLELRDLSDRERPQVFFGTDRTIEVDLAVEAELLTPVCGQPDPDNPIVVSFSSSSVIPYDDVEFGVPIEITARQAVPEIGPDAFVDVLITLTITSELGG